MAAVRNHITMAEKKKNDPEVTAAARRALERFQKQGKATSGASGGGTAADANSKGKAPASGQAASPSSKTARNTAGAKDSPVPPPSEREPGKLRFVLVLKRFDASVGGSEGFAVAVVRELAARNHHVMVLCETSGSKVAGVLVKRARPLLTGRKAIVEFQPDFIFDWGYNMPADVRRVGSPHEQFLIRSTAGLRGLKKLIKTLEIKFAPRHRSRIVSERALLDVSKTRIIAQSDLVAADLKAAGVARERIAVLRNGVDIERFSPEVCGPLRDPARTELKLKPAHVVFLMVAHNPRLRNLELMEKVFSEVYVKNKNVRLVHVGRHPAHLHAPWFVHAGKTSEPEKFYAVADALIHPTLYDACSNAVLEGMASGLPVISSDANGGAELIEAGKSGVVLPVVGDVASRWVTAVTRLAAEKDRRVAMGEAARVAMERRPLRVFVDELEAFLRG